MTQAAIAGLEITFPSPPDVLLELKDAGTDLNAVGDVINSHPDLAKEVLATINAPYFSLVREIKNAEEAVRMLGMHRIVNLATGRLLRTTIFSGKDKLLLELWKTSVKVAVIAVLVCKELDIASTDEVYTCSVFHNSGMALLNQAHPEYSKILKNAYFAEDSHISAYEREHLGISHAELGARLAGEWGLSASIAKSIHLHHDPELLIPQIEKRSEAGELLLLLKIAEQITRLPGYLSQCPHDNEWAKIKEPIFDELKMTEGMYRRFELVIKKKMAEIKG